MQRRILHEAGQPVTNCYQFKLRAADGKMRGTPFSKLKEYFALFFGNESVTNCNQLKLLAADGKRYLSDVADAQPSLRL